MKVICFGRFFFVYRERNYTALGFTGGKGAG